MTDTINLSLDFVVPFCLTAIVIELWELIRVVKKIGVVIAVYYMERQDKGEQE